MRYAGDPESREQSRVVKLFRRCGCTVYSTSRPRAQGCAGLPDLYVIHQPRGLAFWWETKAPGGKLSPEQLDFADQTGVCGVKWSYGGYEDAVRFLELAGVIVPQSKRTA